jgi:SAM-dependent methyltransferase
MSNGWLGYPLELWNAQRPGDSLDDLPFWTYCAEKYGGPVLDLCCGTGRISIPLAEQGLEVVGVDLNPGFIACARERTGAGLPVSFQVGDITRLSPAGRFRLAIMPDWSFQVLLTTDDQLSFLHSLRTALVPGGAFAFNLFIPFHRQRGLVERGGGYEWTPDPAYHHGARRLFDHVAQIETLIEPGPHAIRLRHTTLPELRLLFDLTGFAIAELHGDTDRRPFTGAADDDTTIVVQAQPGV